MQQSAQLNSQSGFVRHEGFPEKQRVEKVGAAFIAGRRFDGQATLGRADVGGDLQPDHH
jgi:hypothetical protein